MSLWYYVVKWNSIKLLNSYKIINNIIDVFLHFVTLLLLKSNDPQAQGSAITYAKRYQLQAILGIAGEEEDDDAQKADKAAKSTKKAKETGFDAPAGEGLAI